jgi:hypothetical protein
LTRHRRRGALYEMLCCARRIKEYKLGLFADRTSAREHAR